MRIKPGEIRTFINAPPPKVAAVLIYGPDAGLVRERAEALVRRVAGSLDDPFRIGELSGTQLKDDPARLVDEMFALSLAGGRRAVRVRSVTDTHSAQLETLFEALAGRKAEDAGFVVVEAGDLGPRSSLRLLFEEAANGAAIPCYLDSPEELEAAIVYLRKAIQEFDLLLASDPRSMSNRYYLGVSHRLLGGKLAERGELTAAAEAYEAATKPIQSLALGNPEVTAYRAELAVLAMNRGTVYSATEKFVPAREAWEEAKKLTAELMEHDPEDPQLRTDLANSLGALGDLHRREGQKDQAIACFEQAQEQLRILREKDPQNNWLKSLWDENQELIRELKSDTPESQPKPTPSVDRE